MMKRRQTRLSMSLTSIQTANSEHGLERAFHDIRDTYGFRHLTFLLIRNPATRNDTPAHCTTYPTEWTSRYVTNNYFAFDPVVQLYKTNVLPIDWSSIDRNSDEIKTLFREATAIGVGHHGLTVPVRGIAGERSIFSATSNRSVREWRRLKTSCKHDLMLLAYYTHERFIAVSGGRISNYQRLSRREQQCLQLLSSGKVPKQIASNLQLSESAVRLYLSSARRKLGAATIYQAIARATCCEVIDV